MDARPVRPATPRTDAHAVSGLAGGRQHATAPWAPVGAPSRYDIGGERPAPHTVPSPHAPPSALTAPPPSAPPPSGPSPAGPPPSGARPAPAAGTPVPAAPAETGPARAGTHPDTDHPDADHPGADPAGSTSTGGVRGAKQPGAEAPWAFQRQAHWEMPAQPGSVPAARRCTALLLTSWGVQPEDVEQLVLLVSELTTNAALHGRRDMSVELTLAGSHVDLTVSDHGPDCGVPAEKLPADECGRGLEIVSALADGLHVQRHRTGTNAWASYRLASCRRP